MSEFDEQLREYNRDLAKIQDQYNYDSHGYGSIDIHDMDDDNGMRVVGVNWSCCGTVDTKHAKAFAEALSAAIEACERFNATHSIPSV